ncbi:hypothetical protein N7533_004394 [Penicillium manginii]|jgi:hypothetical protein|uniref:uncharacterized protein n=1 Tax=Penicillium manginii TaxID=203109 RepID=UPI0025485D5D|nr:uncharacterized protein N7533_004394 [Penicillium manginii]KAJ5754851.1 hypothetical protein N7533_004394 [Penicillium manginii]
MISIACAPLKGPIVVTRAASNPRKLVPAGLAPSWLAQSPLKKPTWLFNESNVDRLWRWNDGRRDFGCRLIADGDRITEFFASHDREDLDIVTRCSSYNSSEDRKNRL